MVPQHDVTNEGQPDEHHSVQELGRRSRAVFGLSGALKMQDKLRPGRFADVLRYQIPFDKIVRGRRGL